MVYSNGNMTKEKVEVYALYCSLMVGGGGKGGEVCECL